MEILRTQEIFVNCPYDPAHHIRKYRMEGHLVKCRRNYHPDVKTVTCDFNTRHEVPLPELAYHYEYCPDRKFLELSVFQESGTSSSGIVKPSVDFKNFPVEDWDDGVEHSYDPESYCVTNEILRKVSVQSAAKRRNFRLMERHRFNQLQLSKEIKKDQKEAAQDKEFICKLMEKLSTEPIGSVKQKMSRAEDVPNYITGNNFKLTDKKND